MIPVQEHAVNGDGNEGLPAKRARDGGMLDGVLRRAAYAALAGALGWSAAHGAAGARDTAYVQQRRALETARYLHDIEGDAARARQILERLSDSPYPAIRAQTLYLRAGFLEEAGNRREAARLYREAFEGEGLEPPQKQRLVARLLALNPESVRPFREAGRMRGLPARVFETSGPQGSEYILVEDVPDGTRPGPGVRLLHQNTQGQLRALPVTLGPDEEVLDATLDRVLTRTLGRQRVLLRKAPHFRPETVLERFSAEEGHLFTGDGDATEFVVIGPQSVRVLRDATPVSSHPLPGAGCSWTPSTLRARQGVIFCADQGLYRADFARRTVSPIPLSTEFPLAVHHAGEYLALRFADRIEFRRGPAYDAFLWGVPAGMQDALAIGNGHAFVAAMDGPVRAYVLRNGQLDWQREDLASSLRVHGGHLFILTHARMLLAVDPRGRLLYSYEAGWDGEDPLLLPAREWVVVHNPDGRRVRLSRELLRLTGGSRDHLFRAERENLRRGDASGALRELDALLALEPGNGTAWREKARLLAAGGAPRAEQTHAWAQAARSHGVAPWSADPALEGLAAGLGATWVWKRQPGPRFFPVLTGGRVHSFYVENNNQTLVVLDTRNGSLKGSFHFNEPLDMKVTTWTDQGDTLIVSSPGRLYIMTPGRNDHGNLTQIPLRGPVCHAVMVPEGLLLSDWNGNVRLVNLRTRETVWEVRLGRGGILLAAPPHSDHADAFEIEGGWHRIRLSDGASVADARMPPGTITEIHAGREFAYAGYNEGLIIAIDKDDRTIAWQRDLGEQIFSLSGRGDQVLLVGTASKRVISLHARTGMLQAQAQVASHLFNRPLLTADGYWVGTEEPALEKRSLNHELLHKFPLTDMPGTPSRTAAGIAVSTQDHFIVMFPAR